MQSFYKALAAAQSELRNPAFDKSNNAFKTNGEPYRYASLAAHLDAVRPVLAKHGLAVVQLVGGSGGELSLTTRIAHASGESMESTVAVPMPANPQHAISWVTYLRRTMLASALALCGDDDDDGNTAATPAPKPAAAPAPRAKDAPAPAVPAAAAGDLITLSGIVAEVTERTTAKGTVWDVRLETGDVLTAWKPEDARLTEGEMYEFRCAVKPATNPKYPPYVNIREVRAVEVPF